ncbi:TRAP transporter small permease [Pseudogracilibacillus auburnensis]|uniref:TRAP-type C4-dicarboxylate transport system permease small subunit n=1 Tax=Pseudogracilibacillus auburnensis TaxID=1494959 RepID=A0A2V3VQA3_9BACI|nr:TRAP transporter small permease subunit [Pseudogracilibacillus auburnensis]PXW83324.1 TRAP-type C4-dicarboxylate transport system permease small subunit [Pseudogracilibacillus auburnensis]
MNKIQIRGIKDIFDLLAKMIIIFTSSLMVLLTAVVFFNVIIRYFFSIPIAFTYEMVELLFPWIVFLAIINVTLHNENIDIQFFVKLLPKSFQLFSAYFTKIVMLFFSVYITKSSFSLASTVQNHTMPILGISKSWLYWSVSVSFVGVSLVIIYQIVLMVMGKNHEREGGETL